MPNYLFSFFFFFVFVIVLKKKEDNKKKRLSLSCNYEKEIAMNLPVSFIYVKSIEVY
jgi:hypothetical protein